MLRDITIAGDLRRSSELVSDLQLVAIDPRGRWGHSRTAWARHASDLSRS
jgi:hypothetical protein